MSDRISVKPDTVFLEDLLDDVSNGKYKIPVFQRDFVWKTSQILDLFDSISKGYPIGSLLFWQATGYVIRNEIGPYIIEKETSDSMYVLDGFQRISTLFGVLMNPEDYQVKANASARDFLIYFDLKENGFTHIKSRKDKGILSVPLYRIYDNRELFKVLRELDREDLPEDEREKYIESLRDLHNILHKYKLPYVEIRGGDIKSAVEIFSRVNSTGVDISEDSMLSALSYDGQTGFILSESITEFLNELNVYNFENLKRDTVLNCISNATGSIHFDNTIEDLRKQELASFTEKAYVHIRKAIRFLYKELFIIDVRLLPYPTQLVFISEYFRLNPEPACNQCEALKKWFWTTTYSSYFTLYSLSQQRTAYTIFCEFAKGNHPNGIYKVNDVPFTVAKYPVKMDFTGVRPKALRLFYLNSIAGASARENQIRDRESLKEMFIYSKVGRDPANVILRLSSEFEMHEENKEVWFFINYSSIEILRRHFITPEMVSLYNAQDMENFISQRGRHLKLEEKKFVENLKIIYSD